MSDTLQNAAIDAAVASAGLDVSLENFEGPLDLLLYLIRKNDLDIYDIPIASITKEYLSYLDLMKDLNLETAGEFLVMASTLMQIKAQMLLPAPEALVDEGPDPRTELVNKLLEYQQYKEAASVLTRYNERAKDVYYRTTPPTFGEEDFTLKASVFDLLGAFKRILEAAPREVGQILRDEIPLEVKIREVLDLLAEKTSVDFAELFPRGRRRIDLIVTFMALLELIRLKQIVARQSDNFAEIRIYRADAAPVEAPVEPPIEETPQPQKRFFDQEAVGDPATEAATGEVTAAATSAKPEEVETMRPMTVPEAPILNGSEAVQAESVEEPVAVVESESAAVITAPSDENRPIDAEPAPESSASEATPAVSPLADLIEKTEG